jgi:hypothetical protein
VGKGGGALGTGGEKEMGDESTGDMVENKGRGWGA